MVGLATFMIVSKEDVPQYECDFGRSGAQAAGGAPGGKKEDAAHLHQFVMHAALDFVDERQWETNAMNLKLVDRFNDLLVYAFVTAGGSRFLFLHDQRNEENVRDFFHEVHELYLRIQLNPFHRGARPSRTKPSTRACGRARGGTSHEREKKSAATRTERRFGSAGRNDAPHPRRGPRRATLQTSRGEPATRDSRLA